jgi:hypothetical protein
MDLNFNLSDLQLSNTNLTSSHHSLTNLPFNYSNSQYTTDYTDNSFDNFAKILAPKIAEILNLSTTMNENEAQDLIFKYHSLRSEFETLRRQMDKYLEENKYLRGKLEEILLI